MKQETILSRIIGWALSPFTVRRTYIAHRSDDDVIDIDREG